MPLYEFKCRGCGHTEAHVMGQPASYIGACPTCGDDHGGMKRLYSVNVHRPMARHFNQSVGKEIGSERQFRDELKRKGDAEYARTGIETDYQPLDPEIARKQVEKSGGAGLDSTNRVRAAHGQRTVEP